MNFEQVPEFQKELKRLAKRWRSLEKDIEFVKPRIESLYVERDDININLYRTDLIATKKAAILPGSTIDVEIIKMRLDVESLHSNNKVRIIFIAIKHHNLIKFIEIYAKNEQDREDKKRIVRYLKEF